jgi:hypothetical protein
MLSIPNVDKLSHKGFGYDRVPIVKQVTLNYGVYER